MNKIKILCVIPTLPNDLNAQCVPSIVAQTVPVETIVLLHHNLKGGTTAQRVSWILNEFLEHHDIAKYDYLLRVDCDTILLPHFLSTALQGSPDIYGESGYTMLIKVSTFKRLMNCRFNKISDDQYIFNKFMYAKAKAVRIDNNLIITRPQKWDTPKNLFCGEIYYRLGWEPFHIIDMLRRPCTVHTRRHSVILRLVLGYFIAMIKRLEKFDFAPYIWSYQVRRLARLKGDVKR